MYEKLIFLEFFFEYQFKLFISENEKRNKISQLKKFICLAKEANNFQLMQNSYFYIY